MNVLPLAVLVSSLVAEDTAGLRDVVAVGEVFYGVGDSEVSVFTVGETEVVRGVTVPVGNIARGVAGTEHVCVWGENLVSVFDTAVPEAPLLAYNLTVPGPVLDASIDSDNATLYILTGSSVLSLNLTDPTASPIPLGLSLPDGVGAMTVGDSLLYYSTPTELFAYNLETDDLAAYPQTTAYSYLREVGDNLLLALTDTTAVILSQYSPVASFPNVNALDALPSEGLIAAFGDGYAYHLNATLDVVEVFEVTSNATSGAVLFGSSGPTFVMLSTNGVVVAGIPDPPATPSSVPADTPSTPADNSSSVTVTAAAATPVPAASDDDENNALHIIIPILCVVVLLCCGYTYFMYRKGRAQSPSFDDEPAVLPKGDVNAEMSPVKGRSLDPLPSFSPALGPGHAPPPNGPARQERGFAEGTSGRSTPVAVDAGNAQAALPPLAKRGSPLTREEQPVEIDIDYSHFTKAVPRETASPLVSGLKPAPLIPVAPLSPHSLTSPLLREHTASTIREGSPRGSEYNERSPFYSPPVIPNPPDSHGIILDTQTGKLVMSVRGSPSPVYNSPQKGASPLAPPPTDLLKELDITPAKNLPKAEKASRGEQMALIRAKHEENERLDKILELARVGYDVGGLL